MPTWLGRQRLRASGSHRCTPARRRPAASGGCWPPGDPRLDATTVTEFHWYQHWRHETTRAITWAFRERAQSLTEEIAEQGLRKDICALAHKELDAIESTIRRKVEPYAPAEDAPQTAAEDRDPRSRFISPWEPRRPSAGLFPQSTGRSRR